MKTVEHMEQLEGCKKMGLDLTHSLEQIQVLVNDSMNQVKEFPTDLTPFIAVLKQISEHIQDMSQTLHQNNL